MNLKKLLGICLADKWLKLLAVAFAIVTWVYVSQITRDDKTKDVRLRFKAPDSHFIMPGHRAEVEVTVEGPAVALARLPENLVAHIDVAEKKKGTMPEGSAPRSLGISLSPSDIQNLPAGLTVKGFEPSKVNITLDKMDQKRVPVAIDAEADLNGLVKDGFEIYRIYAAPNQVVVRGPRSVLSGVESVHPKPIPISGLNKDFTVKNWPLETTVDHSGTLIDCLQVANLDQVTIKVIPKKEKATVKNVRVEVRGLPGFVYAVLTEDNTKPFTAVPQVEIQGPKTALADATVRAFIDLTDILDPNDKPEVKREVQFAVGPDIEVLTKPPSVMVKIKMAPAE